MGLDFRGPLYPKHLQRGIGLHSPGRMGRLTDTREGFSDQFLGLFQVALSTNSEAQARELKVPGLSVRKSRGRQITRCAVPRRWSVTWERGVRLTGFFISLKLLGAIQSIRELPDQEGKDLPALGPSQPRGQTPLGTVGRAGGALIHPRHNQSSPRSFIQQLRPDFCFLGPL